MTDPLATSQSTLVNPVIMTLAVATIGRTDELKRLFDSLARQKCKAFEVVLADQNQDDRLKLIVLDAINKGVGIVHCKLNEPNQYAARTLGIEMAKGQYLAFPDDDCWYEEDTILQAIDAFKKADTDALIGRWLDASKDIDAKEGTLTWEEVRNFRSEGSSMITQFYKTESLRAIGGFDNRIGLGRWFGGGEDTDILFSTLTKGMKVVTAPKVVVRHRFQIDTTNKPNYKAIRSRARGTGALYAKYKVPIWVIIRGFIAPTLWPIFRMQFGQSLASGILLSLGRIEGYLKWKFD